MMVDDTRRCRTGHGGANPQHPATNRRAGPWSRGVSAFVLTVVIAASLPAEGFLDKIDRKRAQKRELKNAKLRAREELRAGRYAEAYRAGQQALQQIVAIRGSQSSVGPVPRRIGHMALMLETERRCQLINDILEKLPVGDISLAEGDDLELRKKNAAKLMIVIAATIALADCINARRPGGPIVGPVLRLRTWRASRNARKLLLSVKAQLVELRQSNRQGFNELLRSLDVDELYNYTQTIADELGDSASATEGRPSWDEAVAQILLVANPPEPRPGEERFRWSLSAAGGERGFMRAAAFLSTASDAENLRYYMRGDLELGPRAFWPALPEPDDQPTDAEEERRRRRRRLGDYLGRVADIFKPRQPVLVPPD